MILPFKSGLRYYRVATIVAVVVFTCLILGMFYEFKITDDTQVLSSARIEAISNVNKDVALRLWATHQGGIYVPVSDKIQPNPYLNNVPENSIFTPSGRQLTLVNPAWMLKMIMVNYSELYGITSKITSLNTLNPDNDPDDWEREALLEFESGAIEKEELTHIDGKPFLRYIRPFKMEEGCLKCHGHQGYEVGQIKGGISVQIPMEKYLIAHEQEAREHIIAFLILWSVGTFGIGLAYFFGARHLKLRDRFNDNLQKSELRYRSLFESSNDAVFIHDSAGKILQVNSKACEMLGYKESELLGKRTLDLHSEKERIRLRPILEDLLKKGAGRFESALVRSDGSLIDVEISTAFVGEDRKIMQGVVRDVTEHKRYETELAQSAKLYETLMDAFPGAAMLIKRDTYEVIVSNKAAAARGSVAGAKCFTYGGHYSPCETCKAIECFSAGKPIYFECQEVDRILEAHWIPISDDMYMHYLIDVTDRKRMEEDLIKGQRLESLALFAGGLAHDFNNIMSSLWGNIQLATRNLDNKEELIELLYESDKACARAKNLTSRLLTIAKGGTPVLKKIGIESLIRDNAKFMVRGSPVTCDVDLPANLWKVVADEGQIEQVIQNLLVNAVQAMPEGGNIKVTAYNMVLTAEDKSPIVPGRYVRVRIADNGPGISPDNLDRIFEPYFTTKKTGSGLGLATSYSILKKHSGILMVDSDIGHGAAFEFYLPAAD